MISKKLFYKIRISYKLVEVIINIQKVFYD